MTMTPTPPNHRIAEKEPECDCKNYGSLAGALTYIGQLERSLAAARKDGERLDWLENNRVQFLGWHPSPDMGGNQWTLRLTTDYRATRHATRTARSAIDAAMQAGEGKDKQTTPVKTNQI